MKKYAVSLIYTKDKGTYIHNELWIVTAKTQTTAINTAIKAAKPTATGKLQLTTVVEIV